MAPGRKILSLVLWLFYALAVTSHVTHHVVEAVQGEQEESSGAPCSDCVALGALGLLLVTTPRLPGAMRQLVEIFLSFRAPARVPVPASRRRPSARAPPSSRR
jgi:hypothetical protein